MYSKFQLLSHTILASRKGSSCKFEVLTWVAFLLSFPVFLPMRVHAESVQPRLMFIDTKGQTKFLTGSEMQTPSKFQEGLFRCRIGREGFTFFSKDGQRAFPEAYRLAHLFSFGLAASGSFDNWGYIDKSGKYVIRQQFSSARPFKEGMAAIRIGNRCGFVERNGAFAIKEMFDSVGSFSEGLAAVQVGNKIGFIDRKGIVVIKPQFDQVGDFSDGVALAIIDGERSYYYIDHHGRRVLTFSSCNPNSGLSLFSHLRPFVGNSGLAVTSVESMAATDGYAGWNGCGEFDTYSFHEGLALVRLSENRVGYVNHSGKFVISPVYEGGAPFNDGFAVVQKDGKPCYVDRRNNILPTPELEYALNFSNGLAGVKLKNGKWGFINSTGKLAIPAIYDAVDQFSEGLAFVKLSQ